MTYQPMPEKMIIEKVASLMVEMFNYDRDKITLESRLIQDIGIDSLDAIEVQMRCDDLFRVQTDDKEWEEKIYGNCNATIGDVIKSIKNSDPVLKM